MALAVVKTSELRAEEREWRRRGFRILATLVWLRCTLPGALNYLTEVHLSLNIGQVAPRTPLSVLVANLLTVAIAGVSAWCLLHRARDPGGPRWPLLLLISFTLYGVLDQWGRGRLDARSIAYGLVTVLVILAVKALSPNLDQLTIIAKLAAATSLYCLAYALVSPQHANFGDSSGRINSSTKAIVGTNQLAGVFGHSNTLGLFCALTLPFVASIKPRGVRVLVIGALVTGIVASSSRASIFVATIFLVLLMIRALFNESIWRRTLFLSLGFSAACVLILPFMTDDPRMFTHRGAIWIVSLQQWRLSPIFGQGVDWYESAALYSRGLGAQASSGHNLVVTWLATGGLIVASLGFLTLGSLSARVVWHMRRGSAVPAIFLLAFMVASIVEYIWVNSISGELYFVVGFPTAAILLMRRCDGASIGNGGRSTSSDAIPNVSTHGSESPCA
jgi:hypothetical protein